MKIIVLVLLSIDVIIWVLVIRKKLLKKVERKDCILFLFCMGAGILALMPMVLYHASNPYADGYTYVSIADYLIEHGYGINAELDPYSPWLTQVVLYQKYGLRIGAQLFLAFWSVIFSQHYSIVLLSPISGFGICFLGVCVWYYHTHREDADQRNIIYAIVFSAFNSSIIIWSAVTGFIPQLFGLALIIIALCSFKETMIKGTLTKYIESGFIIAALCICYSEIVPFFALMVFAIYVLESHRKGKWAYHFKTSIIIAIISVIIMGPYIFDMFRALIMQLKAVVGSYQEMDWLSVVSWLLSSVPVQYRFTTGDQNQIIYIGITLLLVMLLLFGYRRNTYEKKKQEICEGIIISIPFLLMLIYFEYIAANPFGPGIGNTWSIYKLAQYVVIIPICYLFMYFGDVFRGNSIIKRILTFSLPLCFICMSIVYTVNFSYSVTRSMFNYTGTKTKEPITEYIELGEKYKNEDKIINLIGMPLQQRKLITYFLHENKLASDWSSDNYFSAFESNMDPPYAQDGITLISDPNNPDALAGIVEVSIDGKTRIDGIDGVGSLEQSDTETWSWNQQRSTYLITRPSDASVIVNLQLSCMDHDGESYVDIYLGDLWLMRQEINDCERTPVIIKIPKDGEQENKISLVYSGDTEMESSGLRELILCVWNIRAEGVV